jgi:SpoVK/Ycf46/Vps4 family AAA+-type ATPase
MRFWMLIKNLFTEAKKHAPSIIFIDEIDSIGFSRREEQAHTDQKSTINQLLIEINDLPGDSEVLVIAATNNISRLDIAMIRSGRFDIKMAVSPPSEEERRELFLFYLIQLKREFNSIGLNCFEPKPEDLDILASASSHFTPSDIDTVVKKFRLNMLTDEVPDPGVEELLNLVEGLKKSGFLTLSGNEVKHFLEECRKYGLKQEKNDILAREWSISDSPVGFRTK